MVSLLYLAALVACGGGDKTTNGAVVTGNWQISLQQDQTNVLRAVSGFLLQAGDSVSGNLLFTSETNHCAGVGPASGQVNGSALTLTVGQTGQTITLTGTVANGNSSMSGNYSILASPCGNTQTGTWTGNQVPPFTGNLQGTLVSTSTAYDGQQFQLSGTIRQGPNTGGSTANLSGSIATTDPCLASASISGQISGTAVVLNVMSAEGVSVAQIRGTAASDATSIAGTFNISNSQTPPVGGCQDFGTTTITVQH